MKLNYSIGIDDDPEIEMIHEYSLKILNEVGAVFHSPEALEIFKKHGARVDGETVYIPEKMVKETLETVPSSFDWYDRLGGKVTIGDGEVHHIPIYGPMYVLQEGKYERINHDHFVNFHKLYETSPVVEASNPNILDVSYVPAEARESYRLGIPLKYCVKPMMGLVEGKEVAETCLDIMYRFYGCERGKRIAMALIDNMSPIRLSTAMAEALMVYAEHNQPIMICGGGGPGLTVPQTYASAFTLGNANLLASIALTQLVNPGTPVIYSGYWMGGDLRLSSGGKYSGIEALLGGATCKRMSEYYQIPLHCNPPITESKVLDYQCGAESMMHLVASYLMRVDCILHSTSVLDSMNSASYEKMMLDEENILACKRLLRGYEVSEEKMEFDVIKEIGPAGYKFQRTKPSFYEDYFVPQLAIRYNHNHWVELGCPTAENRATEAWKKRLEEYELPELDKDQEKILDELIPKEYR